MGTLVGDTLYGMAVVLVPPTIYIEVSLLLNYSSLYLVSLNGMVDA